MKSPKKMNQKIKEMWLQALRSGKYRKGKKTLMTLKGEIRYCCLGVLCDLHRLETGKGEWTIVGYKAGRGCSLGDLPSAVQRWAGVEGRSPSVIFRKKPVQLFLLNDGTDEKHAWDETGIAVSVPQPLSFKKIADLIEASL